MQQVTELLTTTALDHAQQASVASCITSCAPVPDHLQQLIDLDGRTSRDRPLFEQIDTAAVAAFASRIAAKLASVPASQRAAARAKLLAALEALP